MRGDIATGEARLPGRCAATGEGQTWLSPLQVTPRLALPPSPDNSGHVRSFRRLAGRAVPSRVRAESCQWRVVLLRAVGARRPQPPGQTLCVGQLDNR